MKEANQGKLEGRNIKGRPAVLFINKLQKDKWIKTTGDQLGTSKQRVLEKICHGHY